MGCLIRGMFRCAFAAAALWGPAHAGAAYVQNFDGLNLGPINGQDGWTGEAIDVVQNTNAKSLRALQARSSLAVRRDGIFDSYAAAPAQNVRFDYMLTNVGSGTSNIEFTGPADTPTANRYVRLNYVGPQNAFFIEGATATLVGPKTVQPNVWYDISIDFDFSAKTADFLIRDPSGTIYFDPAPMSMLQPIVANSIGLNAAQGPALYMDNLAVTSVPEPGAGAALLACATVFGSQRRRRRPCSCAAVA